MRDRWRAEAFKVKASWMAGVVPSHEREGQGGVDGEQGAEREAGEEAQNGDDPLLQPTIISDADGAAEMSRQVDDKVESGMAEQMKVAEEVVRGSVERSEGMEMELWLGQAVGRFPFPLLTRCTSADSSHVAQILDGFSSGAGDEDQAARFVLDRLEDAFFEAGLSLDESK